VDAGSQEGIVNEAQKELINRIFELGDRPVTDIMVPRVEMFCLPLDMPVDEMLQEIAQARQERVPVYTDDKDDIVGILFARDLLNDVWHGKSREGIKNLLKNLISFPNKKPSTAFCMIFRKTFCRLPLWWMNMAGFPEW